MLRRSRDVPTANNTITSLLYCSHVPGEMHENVFSIHPANCVAPLPCAREYDRIEECLLPSFRGLVNHPALQTEMTLVEYRRLGCFAWTCSCYFEYDGHLGR